MNRRACFALTVDAEDCANQSEELGLFGPRRISITGRLKGREHTYYAALIIVEVRDITLAANRCSGI